MFLKIVSLLFPSLNIKVCNFFAFVKFATVRWWFFVDGWLYMVWKCECFIWFFFKFKAFNNYVNNPKYLVNIPVICKREIILKAVCVIVRKFVKHQFIAYIVHLQYCWHVKFSNKTHLGSLWFLSCLGFFSVVGVII